MKERLKYMKHESGFFLPYTLVVVLITLMILITSVQVYTNEVNISYRTMQQLEIETLIQMGIAKLVQEISFATFKRGKIVFEFPNGRSELEFISLIDDDINLKFKITTTNNTIYEGLANAKVYQFVLNDIVAMM